MSQGGSDTAITPWLMFKWLKLDIALEGWTWCPLSAWLMQRWDEAWVDIIQYKRSSAAAGNIHAALVSVHWWPQITSAAQRLDPQLPFAVVHIIFIVSYYNSRINNLLSPSSICISISLNANTGPALFGFFYCEAFRWFFDWWRLESTVTSVSESVQHMPPLNLCKSTDVEHSLTFGGCVKQKRIGRLSYFNLPAGNQVLHSKNSNVAADAGETWLSQVITR